MVQNLTLNYSPKHGTLKKQLKYWIQLVLKSKHYPSTLIIHLLVLLLTVRHRFPASFPKWTSLLSLLLVRTTLKQVGLSCLPSPIKQQALTKGKALTTTELETELQSPDSVSDQMVHIWLGRESCVPNMFTSYPYIRHFRHHPPVPLTLTRFN